MKKLLAKLGIMLMIMSFLGTMTAFAQPPRPAEEETAQPKKETEEPGKKPTEKESEMPPRGPENTPTVTTETPFDISSGKNKGDDLKEATFDVGKILNLEYGEQNQNYFKDESNTPIVSFIIMIINFAIQIMGSLAVIVLIAAGFMFMFAQGDQTKLQNAKDMIKYSVIGLVIALLSYIIVISVQSLFVSSEQELPKTTTEKTK